MTNEQKYEWEITRKYVRELYELIFSFESHILDFDVFDDTDSVRTNRYNKILKMRFTEGKTFEQIAEHFSLSKDTISSDYDSLIRFLKRQLSRNGGYLKSFFDIAKENKISLENITDFVKECISLKLTNDKLNERERLLKELEYKLLGNTNKLDVKINDLELSAKLIKRLNYFEIYTISDILKWSKYDLFKNANFGSKSIEELDELLSSLGITWK